MRRQKTTGWHDWFAWHPVEVTNGTTTLRIWLETVQRQIVKIPHLYPRWMIRIKVVVDGQTYLGEREKYDCWDES